ncbi:tRNA glutamyl-Q(34) synthetase GluQRS [Methylibium sp.]|uniref:tRNA glutamyl-Q(34) synthetase GluQRS n=1 Tax=Methylibium sp. TaxID=2067992 RepID=UPI0025E69E03|nr:tRNA glutamyl-Q(34) synthetase GluQRS [Methylibium sp.]
MSTSLSRHRAYTGRFAPSPTGPLHAGSLVAALASWLDSRAHRGRWLVRMEDVDMPRCVPGADREILRQLDALGLVPDAPPQWQSRRGALYATALERLIAVRSAYPCACTRQQIAAAAAALGRPPARHEELVYPGSCRPERGGLRGQTPRAWRLRLPDDATVHWADRQLGAQSQDVAAVVGDFVLKRGDGLWAYQLAVVVDDADQAVSDVVRGADLADNTPRQVLLQRALGLPTPRYLHTPLVMAVSGEKLSKQHGAAPLDVNDPLAALRAAAEVLELRVDAAHQPDWLAAATQAWAARWASRASA